MRKEDVLMSTILKDLNIYVCNDGVLLQLDKLMYCYYDYNAKKQKYICPICHRAIEEEK